MDALTRDLLVMLLKDQQDRQKRELALLQMIEEGRKELDDALRVVVQAVKTVSKINSPQARDAVLDLIFEGISRDEGEREIRRQLSKADTVLDQNGEHAAAMIARLEALDLGDD